MTHLFPSNRLRASAGWEEVIVVVTFRLICPGVKWGAVRARSPWADNSRRHFVRRGIGVAQSSAFVLVVLRPASVFPAPSFIYCLFMDAFVPSPWPVCWRWARTCLTDPGRFFFFRFIAFDIIPGFVRPVLLLACATARL